MNVCIGILLAGALALGVSVSDCKAEAGPGPHNLLPSGIEEVQQETSLVLVHRALGHKQVLVLASDGSQVYAGLVLDGEAMRIVFRPEQHPCQGSWRIGHMASGSTDGRTKNVPAEAMRPVLAVPDVCGDENRRPELAIEMKEGESILTTVDPD